MKVNTYFYITTSFDMFEITVEDGDYGEYEYYEYDNNEVKKVIKLIEDSLKS
jgi:hypothetical protein